PGTSASLSSPRAGSSASRGHRPVGAESLRPFAHRALAKRKPPPLPAATKSCVLRYSTEPALGPEKKKTVDTSTPKAVASLERGQSTRHGRPLADRFTLHVPTLLHSAGR